MTQVHILYLTQYFPPELGAASTRAFEMSQHWIKAANDVTVLTALPNYPFGKFYQGYKEGKPLKEQIQEITVYRCKINPKSLQGKMSRLKNYFSFFLSALQESKGINNFDCVFATVGPIPVALIAYIIAKRNKVPFILEFRDITSEQIKATKYAGKVISFLIEKYELFFACRSDLLITVSDGYKQFFLNNGVNDNKIAVVKNGFDFSKNDSKIITEKNRAIIETLKDKKRTYDVICGYFGTFGISQNLLPLIKKMILYPKICFILIGQGSQYEEIQAFLNKHETPNVLLFPSISEDELIPLYDLIDYSLCILRNSDYFLPTIPSKIFRSMGYRTIPLFLGPDGEAAAIVKEIDPRLYLTSIEEIGSLIKLEKETLKDRAHEICKSKYRRSSQAQYLLSKLNHLLCGSK